MLLWGWSVGVRCYPHFPEVRLSKSPTEGGMEARTLTSGHHVIVSCKHWISTLTSGRHAL